MISQGTVSVLVGCHSPIHSILVVLAWKQVHGRWPEPWELGCIFLHDIGHLGRQYLDDPAQKAEHWRLGADIAGVLFGYRGLALVGGHCEGSGYPKSDMYLPDKTAWANAPMWWLLWHQVVEPRLRPAGVSPWKHAKMIKELFRRNADNANPRDNHIVFMELRDQCQK